MDRDDQIRRRAYDIWVSEGMPDDKAAVHWAQAEAEIGTDSSADGEPPPLGTINETDD